MFRLFDALFSYKQSFDNVAKSKTLSRQLVHSPLFSGPAFLNKWAIPQQNAGSDRNKNNKMPRKKTHPKLMKIMPLESFQDQGSPG